MAYVAIVLSLCVPSILLAMDECIATKRSLEEPSGTAKNYEEMAGEYDYDIPLNLIFDCTEGDVTNCRICYGFAVYAWSDIEEDFLPFRTSDISVSAAAECGTEDGTAESLIELDQLIVGRRYKVMVIFGSPEFDLDGMPTCNTVLIGNHTWTYDGD